MDGADLDTVDRQIVDALLRDGRLSVAELAQRIHVARATAYARFERLRRRGVVRGFRADVDPKAVGLTLAALVLVRADQRGWRQLRHELRDLPGVHFLGLTTGPADFVLLVRARDTAHLRDVILEGIQGVAGVRDTQTVLLLEEDGVLGGP